VAETKLSIRGVSKAFRDSAETVQALAGIDLDVRAGEFVCVLGPSGCGKSTLLNLCAGFERPDTGTIEIDGRPVTGPDPRRMFVFQEYAVFPWMSVRDNIAFGLSESDAAEAAATVEHYVDLIGLQGFENAFPDQLSGGMRQRVAVARALAVRPDILYMDEPLGALDSLTRLKMRAELSRIWQSEKPTVLFVTHDVEESVQLADRIVVLTPRPGRIQEIVSVELERPRDIDSSEHAHVEARLHGLLGVRTAI
jgi:NitT/TauT family transport system ATP-binding protein